MLEIVTRAEAKRRGASSYFTGAVCINGHIAPRNFNSRKCVECKRERDRRYLARPINTEKNRKRAFEWGVNNREATRKRAKARHWRCRDEILKQQREYYLKNHERLKTNVRKWQLANPERANERKKAYKHKKRGAGGFYTSTDIANIYTAQRGKCFCSIGLAGRFEIDHVLPVSRGGSNWPANLQLLCVSCNRSKSDKTMEEWIARLCSISHG